MHKVEAESVQTCEYVILFWFLKASKYFFPIAPPMSFHAP